jgi:hypothetical protein
MSQISDPVLAHIMAYEAYPHLPDALVAQAFSLTQHLFRSHSLSDVGLAGPVGRARDGRFALLVDPDLFPEWCIAFHWDLDLHRAYSVGLMPVW